MTDRRVALAVAAGGIAGAALRWALGWPLLLVNALGSAGLGVLTARGPGLRAGTAAAAGPGLCGGFTTLSGIAVAAAMHLRAGSPARAAVDLSLHVVVAVAAFAAARRVAR